MLDAGLRLALDFALVVVNRLERAAQEFRDLVHVRQSEPHEGEDAQLGVESPLRSSRNGPRA